MFGNNNTDTTNLLYKLYQILMQFADSFFAIIERLYTA